MMIRMTATDRAQAPNARWIALVIVCLGQLMSIMDATIVNVALPQIQHDLDFSQASLTWVLNGYLITFGSFLLLCGRLGDLIGRRRVFLAGVSLFTLASAICGLAQSQDMLVIARFVQGLGGAGAVSAIVAIITAEFSVPKERAKAMSVYTLVISGGGSLGLIAGGAITDLLNWHWIFFINVPVGVATVILGRMWLVENAGQGIGRDVDILGSVLITGSLVVTVYAIVTAGSDGWGSAHTLGFGALGSALMIAFVALEQRLAKPIMPLRVFRVPGLASSSFIRGLLISGMFSTLFIGVLYLEQIRHYGVLTTGLAFLPQTLVMAAMSLGPTAWLVGRFGPRRPLLAGLVFAGAGLALLATAGADAAYVPTIVVAFLLVGLGAAMSFLPLLIVAMARVPVADAGLASGIVNTSLQVSAAIGIAVFGTLSAGRTRTLLHHGTDPTDALLGGYHLALWIAVGCIACALVAAFAWIRATPAPDAADERRTPAASAAA
jgi:EmrB/QacA subfamily drug resistance transporter